MRIYNFDYDGREMQVRANREGENWVVAVFENGKRVASATYIVSNEMVREGQDYGADCVGDLMTTAENDFIRWSSWRKSSELKEL